MSSSLRIKRVNEIIKKEFGNILLNELDNLRGSLVTITKVMTSPDLQHAKVYISVFPEKESKRIHETLNRNIYKFQKILNKRLFMRPVPKIRILEDISGESFSKISHLLEDK